MNAFSSSISTLGLLIVFGSPGHAEVVADFHQLQDQLDTSILDVYDGTASTPTAQALNQDWQTLRADLSDETARSFVPSDFSSQSPAALAQEIGESRALLQQIAALEMLAHQRSGPVEEARTWRDMITLPKFANADDGGLLLQEPADQVRQPAVTQALAKEYIGWQVTRTRQLMDALQHTISAGEANDLYVYAKLAEIRTLAQFPPFLLHLAAILHPAKAVTELPSISQPYDSATAASSVAAWRDQVEATLPNLLSPTDVTRLQRLLARFVDVIPKEYRNGVENRQIVIPLEYKEAQQFTQQAQSLVNELAPVWRRDQHDVYQQYHGELPQKLDALQKQIDQVEDLSVIEKDAGEVGSILSDHFGLSAHRAGAKGQIIEETALDVRDSLNNSLAASTPTPLSIRKSRSASCPAIQPWPHSPNAVFSTDERGPGSKLCSIAAPRKRSYRRAMNGP
jgi:high-affinity iron transporter